MIKSIQVDEEGYPYLNNERIKDPSLGQEIFENIKISENGAFETRVKNEVFFLESFDEPIIAKQVFPPSGDLKNNWTLLGPYSVSKEFNLSTITLDEYDRFHGLTSEGIPFVFSDRAQDSFFSSLDSYDDESITFKNKTFKTLNWFQPEVPVETEKFWSDIYKNETPRWDLGQPSPGFTDLLPRLKIPKSRVLVLGSGPGHDAAYFAEHGHIVTAVDISPEAIQRAKSKYEHLQNLNFVESDVFKLPKEWTGQFDIVIEHTCYCAIKPEKRNDLIKVWKKLLIPRGHLLGVFFAMERRVHPPFGGTEWDLREKLKDSFNFLFWGRMQNSIDRRNGKEFLVYAQKKD